MKSTPQYHFDKHKGYGTEEHQRAIEKYGVCDLTGRPSGGEGILKFGVESWEFRVEAKSWNITGCHS